MFRIIGNKKYKALFHEIEELKEANEVLEKENKTIKANIVIASEMPKYDFIHPEEPTVTLSAEHHMDFLCMSPEYEITKIKHYLFSELFSEIVEKRLFNVKQIGEYSNNPKTIIVEICVVKPNRK